MTAANTEGRKTRLWRKRRMLIAFFFFALFLGLASISYPRAPLLPPALLLVSFVCGSYALRLQLINHGAAHAWAKFWQAVVVILGGSLCSLWAYRLVTSPKPHLEMFVRLPEFNDFEIQLTNSDLTLPFPKKKAVWLMPKGLLRVPIPNETSPVTVQLVARAGNDSDKIEGLMVFVSWQTNVLKCLPTLGWARGEAAIKESASAAYEVPILYPELSRSIPPLIFKPVSTWPKLDDEHIMASVLVRTEGKGLPKSHLGFGLLRDPAANTPTMVLGTNGYFFIPEATLVPAAESAGPLTPANEPMPIFPRGGTAADFPSNSTFVFLGDSVLACSQSSHIPIVIFSGRELLTISATGGQASVSAEFWNKDGKLVGLLKTNKFLTNRLNFASVATLGRSSLVVKYGTNEPLNIRYVAPSVFSVTGTIRLPDDRRIVITKDGINAAGIKSGGNVWRNLIPFGGGSQ